MTKLVLGLCHLYDLCHGGAVQQELHASFMVRVIEDQLCDAFNDVILFRDLNAQFREVLGKIGGRVQMSRL